MKTTPLVQANRDVFVVRRWRGCADGSWRGQVVHLISGERVNFTSDEELLAYIQRRLHTQGGNTSGRMGLR
ncbi:MAG: hypothetical protein KF893_22465 [Caldilineaceae bacterium]|nr:hypothetical protein [Caldilineaceae bacterium]